MARNARILLLLSVGVACMTNLLIAVRGAVTGSVCYWLLSVGLLIFAACAERVRYSSSPSCRKGAWQWWVALLVVAPPLIRLLWSHDHSHRDEYITAGIAQSIDLLRNDFFSGYPRDRSEWVSQYPAPYFFYERLLFGLFGTSYNVIQYADLPFLLLISCFLYKLARALLDSSGAAIVMIVYAVFAPSRYMEELTFINNPGTGFILMLLYYGHGLFRTNGFSHAILSGLAAALCGLFYVGGYLASAGWLAILLLRPLLSQKHSRMRTSIVGVVAFATVLSPFFVTAYVQGNNIFFQRPSQVLLADGIQSPYLLAHVWNGVRFVFADDIGGSDDFSFGRRSLLEAESLLAFLAGACISVMLVRQKPMLCMLLLFIVVSFVGGILCAKPPPAYHRLTGVLPIAALIMAVPVWALLSGPSPRVLHYAFAAALLIALVQSNLFHYEAAIRGDIERGSLWPQDNLLMKRVWRTPRDVPLHLIVLPHGHLIKVFSLVDEGRVHRLHYAPPEFLSIDKSTPFLSIIDRHVLTDVGAIPPGFRVDQLPSYTVIEGG